MRKDADEKYMREALKQAERGRGFTRTNPLVGALIVKDGRVIGRGYHKRFGGAHAEVNAIKNAKEDTSGSTMYVTLEPCSTYGKTPPCTEAILNAGISRVVIASKDPNPVNAERGIRILRRKKVKVQTGLLRTEAEKMNAAFQLNQAEKRPFVILKMAQTLDGKSATREGDSKWITCPESRKLVHKIRHEVDAVMVGRGTASADDPKLTVRSVKAKRHPDRVLLDPSAKINLNASIFKRAADENVFVGVRSDVSKKKLNKYEEKGITPIFLRYKKSGLNLKAFLKELYKKNVSSILVEGGGTLAAGLLSDGLVDKVMFFTAPKIAGGKDSKTSVDGTGVSLMKHAIKIEDLQCTKIGEDFLFEGTIKH